MNTEVPTKYQLSHNDRIVVFNNGLHSENPMLYRPALHGNWNALSLARRALKDKFPTPAVPLTAVLANRHVFLPDPVYYIRCLCPEVLSPTAFVSFPCVQLPFVQRMWFEYGSLENNECLRWVFIIEQNHEGSQPQIDPVYWNFARWRLEISFHRILTQWKFPAYTEVLISPYPDQEGSKLQWPNFSSLNPELNPICYLLALLGAYHFLHVSRKGLNY